MVALGKRDKTLKKSTLAVCRLALRYVLHFASSYQ
jgi:hypothetical protein